MKSRVSHIFSTASWGLVILVTFVCITSTAIANNVRHTQSMLIGLGFNPGPADGLYGGKTRVALEEFYFSIGDEFDGKVSANEVMDLSIASGVVYPGCSIDVSPNLIGKEAFVDNLGFRLEDAWEDRTYYYDFDTRYGPFLHNIYQASHSFIEDNQPDSLDINQSQKYNVLLNKLCFVQKTGTGQRGYFLAAIDFLDSVRSMRDFINEGHALLWDDFPYIETGNKVITAPQLPGLDHYKKYTTVSGMIIVAGRAVSDQAMLAAREMVEYQLSARPEWHSLIRANKMRISLFTRSTCQLPEFRRNCEEGGFAQSETDATSPINASWLCYRGNYSVGGNPLFHEIAHSLQHVILESENDTYFYETLLELIQQAYDRKLVDKNFPAGELWAVAVEGYMMDGGPAYKDVYYSREWIQREHPEMYQLIRRYFPTSPTYYCQF